MQKTADQITSFRNSWLGGYYEGDPLDPLAPSSYLDQGYISVLHAIYQACIHPYINETTAVAEIGPGRGAWTKTMLDAREIFCLDALSAEHNGFWEYVAPADRDKISYFQVSDFSCFDLPDNYFDFLFSFGVFCHITWEGQKEYYRNLFPKLKSGATGVVMFADFDKYNRVLTDKKTYSITKITGPFAPISIVSRYRRFKELVKKWVYGVGDWQLRDKNDLEIRAGKFYHAGIKETCEYLESVGWQVVTPDIGLAPRDPIVVFRKP
jgi:Methyltransferase domain